MRNHRDLALYFVSLFGTLMLFLFCGIFLAVSAAGTGEAPFSVSRPDEFHMRVEALGSVLDLDYTALAEPERLRRRHAPLLTPRPVLTAEYAVDYAAYWAAEWNRRLEEYLFTKEAYGPDAVPVNAPGNAR